MRYTRVLESAWKGPALFWKTGARVGATANLDELLFECGLESLHPGGLGFTDRLVRMCGAAEGLKVLDAGSGRGATARLLARSFGGFVTGVERQERLVAWASAKAREEGLDSRARFVAGDVAKLPFGDGLFDLVLSECTATLVDRPAVFAELLRVLKPGGRLGLSEVFWRSEPPERLATATRLHWDGFTTLTFDAWRAWIESLGLVNILAEDVTQTPAEVQSQMTRDLGLGGIIRLGVLLSARPDLRASVAEYRDIVRDYGPYFGYALFAGTKP